jgi:copper chaperone
MRIVVDGMTCDHCVRAITKAIHAIDANARVDVDIKASTVTIDGDVDPALAKAAIESEGYRVTLVFDTPKACCGA